jgi:hypothetical protein
MLLSVLVAYGLFSALLAWRLVNVVVSSTDADHRRSAVTALTMVWGSGSIGAGMLAVAIRLHELGAL